MKMCNQCGIVTENCVCEVVDHFLDENDDFSSDLAELEAQDKKGAKRCLACYFFICQCAKGLKAKNEVT